MLKKISLLSLCFVVGCVTSKLVVIDFKPYEGLTAFAYIAAEGSDVKKPEVAPPVPEDIIPLSKCKCKGTGKSGDGLGPCNCPKNCYCKQDKNKKPDVKKEVVLTRQIFIFHTKTCQPCKSVDKQLAKLDKEKLGWKIVEKTKYNESLTAEAHIIVVDAEDFPLTDHPITSVPHMMLVVDGKVVKEVNPYGMSFADIAKFYYEN